MAKYAESLPHAPRPNYLVPVGVVLFLTLIGGLLVAYYVYFATSEYDRAVRANEVAQLAGAVERFREQFEIYPPSRIRLRENSAYQADDPFDQMSVYYLQKNLAQDNAAI